MASKRKSDRSRSLEQHDNGAVEIPADDPPRKSKKNNTKLDTALKELAVAKASNALLNEEWNKAQETIRSLQMNLNAPRSEGSDVNSDQFIGDVGQSSTQRHDYQRETDFSRFMASVNQMSVSSVSVPECKPSVGNEEIGRQDFEAWKDLLVDSMKLAGITDEATKFIIFKVKAGQKLLEIFKNTKSTSETPDQDDHPFLNAMFRLKAYFTSGSDVMLQRRKLALMEQKLEENDLSFLMRVGATARLCEFAVDKEFEEIVSTVAEHAKNREVRTAALKLLSRKGTFTDLVDQVREIEAIRLNEEYFNMKHGGQNQATIARVADGEARQWFSGRPSGSGRGRYGSQQTYQGGAMHNRNPTNWRGSNESIPERCFRCNSLFHKSMNCFAVDKVCRNCGVKGHLQRACRTFVRGGQMQQQGERVVDRKPSEISAVSTKEESKSEDQVNQDTVSALQEKGNVIPPTAQLANIRDDGVLRVLVSGFPCDFLIDSGAQVNTFTERAFNKMIENENYKKGLHNIQYRADRTLKAYAVSGEIPVIGTFEAFLFVSEDRPVLLEKFYVVRESQSLLGRPTATRYSVLLLGLQVPVSADTSSYFQFQSIDIAAMSSDKVFPKFNIQPVVIRYDKTKPPCRNIFFNIPIAVKPRVEERLQQLISANIIERVTDEMDPSFCSSMLVIPKGKEDFRLVIDLRGPNQYILRTPFSMPTLEKILAGLKGAKWFSTIDLSNAFYHIELHENSRHLTNFMTEFGMFRCVRLPFGLCNAPDIFQEVLQRKILGDCKGVSNYLDDILISGETKEEHDINLAAVLDRLREHGVEINKSKCVFQSQRLPFLGFILTPEGWQIEEEKLSAIRDFRKPVNCSEVKSFLGLITFVDRFLLHRATETEHLRMLASAEKFYWTDREETEFVTLQKETLNRIKTLGFFSTTDRTELFVDASPVGLGAVLAQFNSENVPRIIACASKSLTSTEQKYPQTHREALAVVWGVERFSFYLTGRAFTVRTDATANEFIYNCQHRIGKRAVSRAEAWSLRLQPYDFTMKRVSSEDNVADALSRLIQCSQEAEPFEAENENHLLYALDGGMNITLDEIEKHSEIDAEMQNLCLALRFDKWPRSLQRYECQKKDLHNLGSLIFKSDTIVLPKSLRGKALHSAHGGHVGEVAMKRIMREFFWWPGMAKDTESFVKNCETCALLARKNPPIPLSSRELPDGPWEILQIDFLTVTGFGSEKFLVLVDTYSRFLFVIEMHHLNAESTNAALCDIFKLWGCPKILQSDNGPPFQSSNFCEFWEEKGVKVRKAIPLSPQSNGVVERQNQGIIKALAASRIDGINWRTALQRFVHNHNTLVPHARLKATPFELMVGWKFRGTFPSLWKEDNGKELDRVDLRERDSEAKLTSKKHADRVRGAKESDIKIGDVVLLHQQRKSKADSSFSAERYTIIARQGAKVVVMSGNGIQYARNVRDVKLAPFTEEMDPGSGSDSAIRDDSTQTQSQMGMTEFPEDVGLDVGPLPTGRNLRSRGGIKKPSRFDNNFVYRIYQ